MPDGSFFVLRKPIPDIPKPGLKKKSKHSLRIYTPAENEIFQTIGIFHFPIGALHPIF